MTTSSTVFPDAAVADVLCALLALTGLRRALVAAPHAAGWRIEAVAGVDDTPSPGTVWAQGSTFCDAVRHAGVAVGIPALHGANAGGTHLDASRLGAASFAAVPLLGQSGECVGVLLAYAEQTAAAYPTGLFETLNVFARSLVSQANLTNDIDAPATGALASGESVTGDPAAGLRKVLSVIGHDVRNPMHSLLAAIEMLKSKPLDPRAARLAGMVETSALRLGELAKGAVDFARVQLLGDLSIHPVVDAPLQTLLDKVVTDIRLTYPQRAVTVAWMDVAAVTCDTARVGEAFGAILSHALRHVGHERTVNVQGRRDETRAVVIDIDVPGYILPAELLPHLFNPFYMVDGDSRVAQLGISLYLAAAAVRAHEGSLTARPGENNAACFTMRLPAHATPPQAATVDITANV